MKLNALSATEQEAFSIYAEDATGQVKAGMTARIVLTVTAQGARVLIVWSAVGVGLWRAMHD